MRLKYERAVFGRCCRYSCNQSHLLPFGLSAEPGIHNVKLFCPCCKEIYNPTAVGQRQTTKIDGAYFGSTFTQYFILTYPHLVKAPKPYVHPTIHGFRLHASSPYWKVSVADFKVALTLPSSSFWFKASDMCLECSDDEVEEFEGG